MGLPISTNSKVDSYNSILILINRLINMINYKLVKININALTLAKIILNIIIQHYSLPNLIVTDKDMLFTLNFWLSLYYFFGVKWRLFIAFYSPTDGLIK